MSAALGCGGHVEATSSKSLISSAGSTREPVVDLGVIITVELADGGGKHEFTVNLLHTVLAEEERR